MFSKFWTLRPADREAQIGLSGPGPEQSTIDPAALTRASALRYQLFFCSHVADTRTVCDIANATPGRGHLPVVGIW